jgi:hypothetical protein
MAEHPSFSGPLIPPGEPVRGETYRADGWAYLDPAGRFSPKMWEHLLALIGDGNYVILAESRGIHPSDGKRYARGQLLVSPAGMASLKSAATQMSN